MSPLRFLLSGVASLLVACAPLAPKPSAADIDPLRRAIVHDIVQALDEMAVPKGSVLVPTRRMAGRFDADLHAALRAAGYVVVATKGAGSRFDATVNGVEGSMYRVTVSMGKSTLSRLWVLDGASAYAGGAWARRE
jgi:hypothetical protein